MPRTKIPRDYRCVTYGKTPSGVAMSLFKGWKHKKDYKEEMFGYRCKICKEPYETRPEECKAKKIKNGRLIFCHSKKFVLVDKHSERPFKLFWDLDYIEKKNKTYRLKLKPFFEHAEHIVGFTGEERQFIEFYFEIPGIREQEYDGNVFQRISDNLIELASSYKGFEKAFDYVRLSREIREFILRKDGEGFVEFVKKTLNDERYNIEYRQELIDVKTGYTWGG